MKRRSKETGALFIDASGQLRLVDKSAEQQALEKGKVECLGMTFDSEDAAPGLFHRAAAGEAGRSRVPQDAGISEGDRRGHHPDVRSALVHGVPQSLSSPTSCACTASPTIRRSAYERDPLRGRYECRQDRCAL